MKAIIISDSHGMASDVMKAIDAVKPDVLIHLGDGAKDCRGLGLLYPDIELYQVAGNCDYDRAMETARVLSIAGIKIFMTHGHTYNVKQGLEKLLKTASERGTDVVLFGHTHTLFYKECNGMLVINPGSIGFSGKYGVLSIKNGKVDYESKTLE